MAERLIKPSGVLLLILFFCTALYSTPDPAEAAFRALVKPDKQKTDTEIIKEGQFFLKTYPQSMRVPEVRLLLADKESDTELAVEKYRSVIKNYSRFFGREYALYKICQILDLKSKWKELRAESSNGIKLFPEGEYINEFRFMHITASLMLEDYTSAKNEALKISENSHDFESLSRAIFLLAEAERKISGNSRSYIYNLRELAVGFRESEIYPSIIYRLAVFYEEKKDYNRAYSAFRDIAEIFSSSPEAELSLQRIETLKKYKPKAVSYIPDVTAVKNTNELDLSPEVDIREQKQVNFYAVAIGPFTREKDSASLIKLLRNYENIRNVKTSYGYMLYLGRYADTENALETRIRLAEEFGINGSIVRFSVQDKKSYIYEDR